MIQINNLTDDADQLVNIVLSDKSVINFEFIYHPRTQLWVMNLTYGTFMLTGTILSVHPNILREFRNNLPFGLAVVSTDKFDPIDINDFVNARISLYVLEAADVTNFESTIFGAGI